MPVPYCFRMRVPVGMRSKILKELDSEGINRERLFPDLDGIASYMTWACQHWENVVGVDRQQRANDSPMQRTLDKLVAAGWVETSIVIDKTTPSDRDAALSRIPWTPPGRKQMAECLGLIRQIENASTPISNDEVVWLKAFAELAAISDTGGTLPSRH